MTLTVGMLARKYGLSRSTLLYYDSIGLLSPADHEKGSYRVYQPEDEKKLEQICLYRKAGLPLKHIEKILNSPQTEFTNVLKQRFVELNSEISELYEQQKVVAGLLQNTDLLRESRAMTKEIWTSLLQGAGFSEEDMHQWHIRFEKMAPQKHLQFLRQLNIPEDEIENIRKWAGSSS
ncbi:MerR family transcriptional regulator [Desulfosediminicola flagellatus]|uniref:MerR family transcriptional regulator n=1 Tax=Desulfosediminicola flagellatus TaxID=2569541 RepID=UPI0010ABB4C5|nr:MerR family transcriptional regulator [Desulfosediminicola flagellatus]